VTDILFASVLMGAVTFHFSFLDTEARNVFILILLAIMIPCVVNDPTSPFNIGIAFGFSGISQSSALLLLLLFITIVVGFITAVSWIWRLLLVRNSSWLRPMVTNLSGGQLVNYIFRIV
jgi:hypothetical protein